MTRASHGLGDSPILVRALAAVLAAAALSMGLYGRFKGIGHWPLGVDEFYVSRSIDNILRSGLPGFPCGGYYTRGLLYQYLVAAVRTSGASPEFAGRFVAAVSSLAVLPAAYLLGRRVDSPLAGWVSAIILCVSVWEIEMARFARMYAPFQAIFTWYLLYYLRYTADRQRAALGWMVALSVFGALTWEGGVLLGFANVFAVFVIHERGRLRGAHLLRIAGLTLLVVVLFLGTRDMRGFAPVPATAAPDTSPPVFLRFAAAFLAPLRQHPGWAGFGILVPLMLACASCPWLWAQRRRWFAVLGLGAAMAACALHWFMLAAGLTLLMLLTRLVGWRELAGPGRYFSMAMLSLLVYWAVLDVGLGVGTMGTPHGAGAVLPPQVQYLIGNPDVYDAIIRPWGRTLPLVSLGIAGAFAYLCSRTIRLDRAAPDAMSALLSLTAFMVLLVGAIPTNRVETRYTFFLYPVLIVLAVTASMRLMWPRAVLRRMPIAIAGFVPLVCFGLTGDFQPAHVAAVDSARINFREGMKPALAAHYYPRDDMRAVGDWLAAHVRPGDVVITGIPTLDQYYGGVDYFFLAADDPRYESYLCPDGRRERWTGHPVLYTMDALGSMISSGRRVFATVYADSEEDLLAAARSHGWYSRRAWTTENGNTHVLLIAAASSPPPAR